MKYLLLLALTLTACGHIAPHPYQDPHTSCGHYSGASALQTLTCPEGTSLDYANCTSTGGVVTTSRPGWSADSWECGVTWTDPEVGGTMCTYLECSTP